VHGRRYRDQLLAAGVPSMRVTYTPLLHGFLSGARDWPPAWPLERANLQTLERSTDVLFFGRVEAYKGVEDLLAAWELATASPPCAARLTIAGPVAQGVRLPPLPPGVELRDRRVFDEEAEVLFRSTSLLVLPYRDATQSALVAAAYAFGVPAIVTDAGALPEYIIPGETGWVVPAGDVAALAAALRRAFADPARLRKMGSAGRAWFETQRQEERATLAALWQRAGPIGAPSRHPGGAAP
jgi:glycosyltransferase involved in cell wall biosynthesis